MTDEVEEEMKKFTQGFAYRPGKPARMSINWGWMATEADEYDELQGDDDTLHASAFVQYLRSKYDDGEI